GKIPGTDLREGTPTMPLLLAARVDAVVRAALAGGPLDGALVRVASTDAIRCSRDAALDYAARARSFLGTQPHREELEALRYGVVARAGCRPPSFSASADDQARPYRLRQHGAGLLPAGRGRRRGRRRADGSQPEVDRRRDRRRADLLDRIRAQRRLA